jgi:hypothetical protein
LQNYTPEGSYALDLLRFIGLPGVVEGHGFENADVHFLLNLFSLSERNKVPLLFLERALEIESQSKSLQMLFDKYKERSQFVFDLMARVNEKLASSKTEYVVFKTFKPFPFITVDIDIIFSTRRDLMKACSILSHGGFPVAGSGAYSVSLFSPKHDMNIDLQLEMSVSQMVYLNKQQLQRHKTEININGCTAPVFDSPAELLTVVAHSFYKEQMFTLSEYYTTALRMLSMSDKQLRTLLELAEQTHVELSLKLILNMVNSLTAAAFKRKLPVLTDTARLVKLSQIEEEIEKVAHNHFVQNRNLPHKFPPSVVAAAFMSKFTKDPLLRGTMKQQFVEIVSNSSKFFGDTLMHINRDTY